MREIKFRGWHVTKKVMFSAEQMANDQLTLLPTGRFINVHGNSTSLSTIFPLDKFIPMQYTGLKDKNGKEIYEGDVLRHSQISETLTMEFYDGAFGYRYLKTFCKQGSSEGMTSMMKEWEIIGNIYENPELLDKPK